MTYEASARSIAVPQVTARLLYHGTAYEQIVYKLRVFSCIARSVVVFPNNFRQPLSKRCMFGVVCRYDGLRHSIHKVRLYVLYCREYYRHNRSGLLCIGLRDIPPRISEIHSLTALHPLPFRPVCVRILVKQLIKRVRTRSFILCPPYYIDR